MDTEQCVSAQYFDIPVLEIEGVVGGYGRGVDGGLVVRSICDGEIGQRGDTDRRRLSDGGRRDGVRFRGCGGDR